MAGRHLEGKTAVVTGGAGGIGSQIPNSRGRRIEETVSNGAFDPPLPGHVAAFAAIWNAI